MLIVQIVQVVIWLLEERGTVSKVWFHLMVLRIFQYFSTCEVDLSVDLGMSADRCGKMPIYIRWLGGNQFFGLTNLKEDLNN